MTKDGRFGACEVGDYDVWVVVFVNLEESGQVLIVKGVTLLFEDCLDAICLYVRSGRQQE